MMTDKILIYGEYQSMQVMLLLWLETLLPEKQIVVAEDIRQAVALVQQHRPRLAVFSFESFSPPQADVIRHVKSVIPGAPVVVLTSNGVSRGVRDAILSGVDVCVSIDTFREQIQPILQTFIQSEMAPGYQGDLQT